MYLPGWWKTHSAYYEEFPNLWLSIITVFNFAHLWVPLFHNKLFDHEDGTLDRYVSIKSNISAIDIG